MSATPGIGETFGPRPEARSLYRAYLSIPALLSAILIAAGSAAILYYVAEPGSWVVVCGIVAPYLVVVGFVAYWIPRYLSTVTYQLGVDRVIFEGGLWWKRKSYVPYNRITNIDVMQGPLSRRFGLGKISIQTAGYAGPSSGARYSEIAIFGVTDLEGIKETVMRMAMRSRPMAVEAAAETNGPGRDAEILEELRQIRKGIDAIAHSA